MPTRRAVGAAGLASLFAGSDARAWQETSIPVQRYAGKLFVPITVNGYPVEALLDTGAAMTSLDPQVARALRLKPGGSVRFGGVNGVSAGRRAPEIALEIGAAPVRIGPAIVDRSAFAERLGRPVDAVLGMDVLGRFVARLDVQALQLELVIAGTFRPPAGAVSVPLSLLGGIPMATVGIEGGRNVQAVVDTGANTALILAPGIAAPLLKGRPVSTALLGSDDVRITTLNEIAFAGMNFTRVPTYVPRREFGTEANLGLEVLSRFVCTFDTENRTLWLEPREVSRPFARDRTGLTTRPEGQVTRVIHVAKASPAEHARWRKGEKIAAIDGRPVAATADRSPPAGATVRFTLADGEERTLVLADYY